MAKMRIEIDADEYWNIDALNQIAIELENGPYRTEECPVQVYQIDGEHFSARIEIEPVNITED